MGREKIKATLLNTRIFLDFGSHPGKDRVPREAAICGATPMVRREGAATEKEDVPLPDQLLLENEVFFNPPVLASRVAEVLQNASKWQSELSPFRDWIMEEGSRFDAELLSLINITQRAGSDA